jgi:tRNA uridine 5-carbamoylmethylation protein Kti12
MGSMLKLAIKLMFMSQLTKEEFEGILDKKLVNLVTIDVLDKKLGEIDRKLGETTQSIIKRIDESQEELARMVAEGFTDIQKRLDVKEKLEKHEKAIQLLAQYADVKEIAAILK